MHKTVEKLLIIQERDQKLRDETSQRVAEKVGGGPTPEVENREAEIGTGAMKGLSSIERQLGPDRRPRGSLLRALGQR